MRAAAAFLVGDLGLTGDFALLVGVRLTFLAATETGDFAFLVGVRLRLTFLAGDVGLTGDLAGAAAWARALARALRVLYMLFFGGGGCGGWVFFDEPVFFPGRISRGEEGGEASDRWEEKGKGEPV